METTRTVEMISPDVARRYLDPNRDNRKVRQHRVDSYADQMRRNQWKYTGEAIKFGKNGRLLDGQHRLLAIIAANVTLPMDVIRGLDEDIFNVLDSGLLRGTGDALGFDIKNSTGYAAISRLMYVIDAGGDPRFQRDRAAVTKTDFAEYFHNNRGLIEAAHSYADRVYRTFRSANKTAWACLTVMGLRVDSNEMTEFNSSVVTGADLGYGDARLALRNWLSNDRAQPTAGHHLALYIKAWNDYMTRTPRQLLSIRPDEPWPVFATVRAERNQVEAAS